MFFLLLPLTGRGNTTAIIALVAYSLLIIFRNIMTGLDNVPAETKDAGRGMGLTDRQLLWRVELPLALPEILAGLRIAATTHGRPGHARLLRRRRRPRASRSSRTSTSSRTWSPPAGWPCCWPSPSTRFILLFQKAVTPWTRARAT